MQWAMQTPSQFWMILIYKFVHAPVFKNGSMCVARQPRFSTYSQTINVPNSDSDLHNQVHILVFDKTFHQMALDNFKSGHFLVVMTTKVKSSHGWHS